MSLPDLPTPGQAGWGQLVLDTFANLDVRLTEVEGDQGSFSTQSDAQNRADQAQANAEQYADTAVAALGGSARMVVGTDEPTGLDPGTIYGWLKTDANGVALDLLSGIA